jgi:diacylglycerol kinase
MPPATRSRSSARPWRDEVAFRQELALSVVLFPVSFLVARSIEQWLLLTTPLFCC